MPSYKNRSLLMTLAIFTIGLVGCGGQDTSLKDFGIEPATILVCKSPETINAAGNACELVLSLCTFPEVADALGLCVEFTGEWPDGANDITMPEPVYKAQAKSGGGFTEVVYYYNRPAADFDGWGIHAWNNAACGSYAQFSLPDGGTDWGIPIAPTGEDPNFGIYWAMDLIDSPNCTNFIPYNFSAGLQTSDLSVDVSNADSNPTGNFFVLARSEADSRNVGTIFPYPRTFESLIVPGGGTIPTVECDLPTVPNEDSTVCLPPIIGEFVPGEVSLYLRGGFNDWGNEGNLNDTTAFHYADGVYTATVLITPNAADAAGAYEFKIADFDWADVTSFGVAPGTAEERTVMPDVAIPLLTGKLATAEDRDVEANIRIALAAETIYQFTMNAADPTAPTLTITQAPLASNLYIRGSMNNMGSDDEGNFSLASGVSLMSYQGENIYAGRLVLEAGDHTFRVANANLSAEMNFGASAGDEALALNTNKTLIAGDDSQDLQFTAAEAGTFLLSMDVTDPAAPVFVVRNAIPYDATVYVRGGMNGWGLNDPMDYAGAGIYTRSIPLDATDYQFKVASEDWATADFGAVLGEENVVLGEAKVMAFAGQNIGLTVADAGDYQFHVDANERLSPILTVRNLDAFAGSAIFVRGGMNDWGTTDVMAYIGNGVYQAAIALTAGDYNFKVASEDWEVANYGGIAGGETTTVDAGFVATPGGDSGNISITIDADGTYLFSADVTNLVNPTIYVSPIARYADAAVFVRGSMNDWGATDEMTFDGVASYSVDLDLVAGDYAFKVADADWAVVNFGFAADGQAVTLSRPSSLTGGGDSKNINLSIAAEADGTYRFDFKVVNPMAPVLTVSPVAAP